MVLYENLSPLVREIYQDSIPRSYRTGRGSARSSLMRGARMGVDPALARSVL